MQNTFRINADLKKESYMEEPVVTQNDAITFLISVFDAGNPFSLSEVTTATLAHTRLDGVTVVTEGTKIDDNTIQFILGTEETKVPGRVSATVQLYDTDERVSTIRFTYTVLKDPTGDGYIPTEREQTLIETVLRDGPLVIQQAQDAANFANEQGQFAQEQASAASEAATNANEAAQLATNAANEANTAAQSANTAAQSANDAAATANEAAQNANQAATSANEAADNAMTQAQYAQQQGDYAKAQGDYAKSVADANKTRWLNPVATFADIATMYPTPQHGDTVQTLDDGKIYRYSSGQWVFKEQYTETAIGALVTEMNKQNRQSAMLTHGTQIVNASQNSPLDIRIEGRTLVNLLGIQGRTATSATVSVDPAKYYLVINEDGTNVTVDGVSQTVPHKFTGKSSASLSWTSGKVALYEVDAAEYNNILTTWTAGEVNRRYPYVDLVQHVQNPYVIAEGENLLPPFTEWDRGINANVFTIKSAYEGTFNVSSAFRAPLSVLVNVLPNTTYTITIESDVVDDFYLDVQSVNTGAYIADTYTGGKRNTFTTDANTKQLKVILQNKGTSTTGTVKKPMLTLGSQLKPFVPRNPNTLFAEVKLGAIGDKKDILWKDGQDWKVTKWVEKSETLTITNNTATLANNAQADTAVIVDESTGEIYKRVVTLSGSGKEFTQGGSGNKTITFNEGYVPTSPKAHYVLATPQTIVVTDKVEGDLVVNGATQVEVGSGVIVREKANPQLSVGFYYLNHLTIGSGAGKLRYRTNAIQKIYKNGIEDTKKWSVGSNNSASYYGGGWAYIPQNDYDTTAEYTVTYLVLDRHLFTTNILAVTATYDSSLKSVVDSVVAKQSDLASNQQALIWSVAELYKRVKALGG